jgi:ABC-type uncharacterized transport system auxiliary subunit
MTRNPWPKIRKKIKGISVLVPSALILLLSVSLFTGCLKRDKPSTIAERYTLEYPSPGFSKLAPIDEAIKIERFSVARAFNTKSMVFRPEPYKLDTYASNRWMVNPGDMVSDYLLRDLRNSGLFKAAFSYRNLEHARYVLEGSVDDFLEIDAANKRTAALTISITLLDLSHSGAPNRLLFQKQYQTSEPLPERTPAGLAQAMSSGMGKLSSMIIRDIHQAVSAPPVDRK